MKTIFCFVLHRVMFLAFIDRDECKKHIHITQVDIRHSFVFPPPKNWGFFLWPLKSILTQFFANTVPSHTKQKKNAPARVLGALKSILDRHLDLFVFLEAKMQGYNRAPLLDRLNRYNQIAFFI